MRRFMRVVNPAAPGCGREGTRRGVVPRRERGRPARIPRRQARLPGDAGRRVSAPKGSQAASIIRVMLNRGRERLRFQRFGICSMRVGNPAVAGPRTRGNKARRWSSPGARAARPHAAPPGAAPRGCGPAGKRSRRLASGIDHSSYVKSRSGTPSFSTVWICSMRVGNPAFAGPLTRGNTHGVGRRRERGRPARMPRRQAGLPGDAGRRVSAPGGSQAASVIRVMSNRGRERLRFQRFGICSMRVGNPAAAGPLTRGNTHGVGRRRERGRPARMPRRQARLPGDAGRRPALPAARKRHRSFELCQIAVGNAFVFDGLEFVPWKWATRRSPAR